MKTIYRLFIVLSFASCHQEGAENKSVCNFNYHQFLQTNYSRIKEIQKEESVLTEKIRHLKDSTISIRLEKFQGNFINYVIYNLDRRRAELFVINGETNSLMVADTLTNIKTGCDVVNTEAFFSSGFGSLIESELFYYDDQLQYFALYNTFGQEMDRSLEDVWKKKYNEQMTLGEIIELLEDMKYRVLQNNIILEKSIVKNCL